MKILLLLSLLPIQAHALGGSLAGNGADVIVCPKVPNQPAVQLLDYYEMQVFDSTGPQWSEGNPVEKVAALLSELAQISPLRAAAYREELNQFSARAAMENSLPDIPDSHNLLRPEGCHIEQLIIQHRTNGVPNYEVNAPLWSQLNDEEKAGALFHELLYGEAIDLGQETSDRARSFLRFLLENRSWTKPGYSMLYKALELHLTKWLEAAFPNGEELLYSESAFSGVWNIGGGHYPYMYIPKNACGAHVITGEWFNHCSRFQPGMEQVNDGQRIVSLDHGKIYAMDGREIGLPFPLIDYTGFSQFTPLNDVRMEDPFLHVWCQGGGQVEIKAPRDLKRFALDLSYLKSCRMGEHAGDPNAIYLDGAWRQIQETPYLDLQRGDGGIFRDGEVQLAEAFPLRVFGASVPATLLSFRNGWADYWPKKEDLPITGLRPLGQKCGNPQSIGVKVDEEGLRWENATFARSHLCPLHINGVGFSVASIDVKNSTEVVEFEVGESITVQIASRDSDGKIKVRPDMVYEGDTLSPYKPGIFKKVGY